MRLIKSKNNKTHVIITSIMRYFIATAVVIGLFGLPWLYIKYPTKVNYVLNSIGNAGEQLASVILSHKPKSVDELKTKYNVAENSTNLRIRVLIVPGHEPGFGGAEYGKIKERDMTVELANDLAEFLRANKRYQVYITRDSSSWNAELSSYFNNKWQDIQAWQKAHKDEVAELIRIGSFKPTTPEVFHNKAPEDVATRLNGINKWADDNDIDIVIHIHINDYRRRNLDSPGKYSGLAIYVPERQYYNSITTKVIADTVLKRLQKYNAVSNLPGEQGGIVEDQDLIAIGSNNSVNAASMLIEYGYIYESQFSNPEIRSVALKDMAFQTYIGIQDFFDPNNAKDLARTFDTYLLPHRWDKPISEDSVVNTDIYALQTALVFSGIYPPRDRSLNDCPRTGKFGPCTKTAVQLFQNKYKITGEQGKVGNKTLDILNQMYSEDLVKS